MITSKLRRAGNSYVVTIPRAEFERLHLEAGQTLSVEVHALELRPVLPPDVRAAFEASWARNEEGYRSLADR